MYLSGNINRELFQSTTCSIGPEKSEIGLDLSEKYFHALGALHGSVYFKLMDDAAYFAVNSVITDVCVLTTSFHINLLRTVRKGHLRALGKLKFRSRNLFIAEAALLDEKGREIGFGTGHFARSQIALTPEVGYI